MLTCIVVTLPPESLYKGGATSTVSTRGDEIPPNPMSSQSQDINTHIYKYQDASIHQVSPRFAFYTNYII